MKILVKDSLKNKSFDEIVYQNINDQMSKARIHTILYLIIIVISSALLLLNVIPNTTVNVIFMIIAFVSLMLLYDSFKEILNMSNALKGTSPLSKNTGILTCPNLNEKGKKLEFFIGEKKLYSIKALDSIELKKYLNQTVTGYFIGNNIFLLEIDKIL